MPKACPDCGAETTYSSRTVEILEATCSACGHAVVLASPAAAASGAERGAVAAASPTAPCFECGGPLAFTVRPDRSLESTCPQCEATTLWAVAAAEGEEDGEDEEEEGAEEGDGESEESGPAGGESSAARPSRFRGPRTSGSWDRRPPRGGPRDRYGQEGRPAPKPCRQCGGPITFQINDDGSRRGSCRSCGNEFTIFPRPEGGGGGFRRGGGFGGPRGRPGGGYRQPWRGGGGGGRRDDDEDDRRRRRRPPRY